MRFDPAVFGGDPARYFAQSEAAFDDIIEGAEKRVVWAGKAGDVTPWSILYVHGFSACAEEIRPVPDNVANGLGANLIYSRMTGHGRGNDAMAECDAEAWAADFAEALAAARMIGERVLIMATSNGCAITTAGLADPALRDAVAGLIFVSPCFEVKNPAAPLLTLPGAHVWAPWIAGKKRTFEVRNPDHGRYWATDYAMVSAIHVVKMAARARAVDHAGIMIPALFFFSDQDNVVRADTIRRIADAWGGPATLVNPELGPGDDVESHVVTGRVLSPSTVDFASLTMLNWAQELSQQEG